MVNTDIVSLVANLSVLAVAGILYAAYIKNLRSQLSLKNEQVVAAEQNVKLWKDRAFQLERQTPQYVEQVLADRIRIREEEITRLTNDEQNHRTEIDRQNREVDQLKKELEAAHEFGRGLSAYDPETREFKQLSPSDLTLVTLGEVWVDTATLLVCDPFHFSMSREREIEDFPVFNFMYRALATGEIFYTYEENETVRLANLEPAPAKELVAKGHLEELSLPTELPADPETYLKSGQLFRRPRIGEAVACTFYNGITGAGICVGTGGDGAFQIRGESYKGELRRIFFDLI